MDLSPEGVERRKRFEAERQERLAWKRLPWYRQGWKVAITNLVIFLIFITLLGLWVSGAFSGGSGGSDDCVVAVDPGC